MKTYWESGGIAPRILDLGMVSCALWQLYPQGKSPRYPLDRRLGGLELHKKLCGECNIGLVGLYGIAQWNSAGLRAG
jgi:hypothetical protein